MKIFHTICAAVMAATIASCDAHQDFPDTSMKIGDILCTDGKVVRYEEMKAQEKTPIAVVFYVNQKEDSMSIKKRILKVLDMQSI